MTTNEAIETLGKSRWCMSAELIEAVDTLRAMALETEEMRKQMQAEDGKMRECENANG